MSDQLLVLLYLLKLYFVLPPHSSLHLAHKLLIHNTGIVGSASTSCDWNSDWNAFKCTNFDYEMFIIESLDEDYMTRRLSPVALRGEGYLTLFSGPRSTGINHGYAETQRMSAFYPVIATGIFLFSLYCI